MRSRYPVIVALLALVVAACAPAESDPAPDVAATQDDPQQNRVLAILGDAWHRVAPLDRSLVSGLREKGWEAVVIMDYNVPWDDFDRYDLIILSREGREYVQYYRDRDTQPQPEERAYWLTEAQEQKFEDYVTAGGRLFLYHDGFGNYAKGRGISRVARWNRPALAE